MLRLRTLGGIAVVDGSGEPIAAAIAQRRPAALAAALAIAADQGLTRDKILGLLWPESDEARARHSLTQALYALRRATGVDDLFVTTGVIRLNSDRIVSDVHEFEHALDAGELGRAVDLYTGPFLDGFHVPGAAEFDAWAARHRSRLEDRMADALETLSVQAESSGAVARAAAWRKRQAALRPLDSDVARKVVAALARAGDRAGALQHGRTHEALLREQLELEPTPAFTALLGQLKSGEWPAEPVVAPRVAGVPAQPADAPTSDPVGAAEPDRLIHASTFPSARTINHRAPDNRRPRRRSIAAATAVGALAIAAAWLAQRGVDQPVSSLAESTARNAVLIAPFSVSGADGSLAYLGAGVAKLLSPRIADDSTARLSDAEALLMAWRRAGAGAAGDLPRDSVVALARRAGAARVVTGNVVGTAARVVLSATMVSLPAGETFTARAQGPADSISAVVDRLAARLLVMHAAEDAALATRWWHSIRALRAYLAGRGAYRRGDYDRARREYESALRADSTFALAALDLAITSKHLGDPDALAAALASAWTHRAALNDLEQARLIAFAGPSYPQPSTAAQQLAAWEQVVRLAPGRAETWYELGTQLMHDGRRFGGPSARDEATIALNRTLAVNPDYVPAQELLAQLRLPEGWWRDSVPIPTTDTQAGGASPNASPFLSWRGAISRGDSSSLRRVREDFPRMDRSHLRSIAMSSQFDASGLGDGLRAIRLLAEQAAKTSEHLDALLAEHSLMLNAGRTREALATTERLKDLRPDSHGHLRLRILDALFGNGDSSAADRAARELKARLVPALLRFPTARRQRAADACVLSQWRLARGDTSGLQVAVDSLRTREMRRDNPLVATPPIVCADLIEASLAVASGRRDAVTLVERLDSLVLTNSVAGSASLYAHIVIARLFSDLGRPSRALDAIRKRGYMSGWPAYLATSLREESRLARMTGDSVSAQESLRRYMALRQLPGRSASEQRSTGRPR